jgi:competence protein ComGD
MKLTSQVGFSLLEVMITLSVIAVLISLSVPAMHSLLAKKKEERILERMEYDILYVQNQAIGAYKNSRIILQEDKYVITGSNTETIVRELPQNWEIDRRKLDTISFNENGTIRKAGTISIKTPKNSYRYVFPLGKGRGYLDKQ